MSMSDLVVTGLMLAILGMLFLAAAALMAAVF
jgi:hypothetical protein